jgi:hypothetical protein
MPIAMPVPMPSMVHSLHGIQRRREGKGRRGEEGRKKADIDEGRKVGRLKKMV